jgi:hypothetical protein
VEEGEDVDLLAVELRESPMRRNVVGREQVAGGGEGREMRKERAGRSDVKEVNQPQLPFAPQSLPESEHSLEHDDSDGIVEDTLSKNDRVELWIHVQSIEDSEDGDGIGSRKGRAEE